MFCLVINLKKSISENKVLVFLIPNFEYSEKLLEITTTLAKEKKKICYVSLNRSYSALLEWFKKNGVDSNKFVFVDAITNTVSVPPKVENCVFVSAPSAFTEIGLAVSRYLNEGIDALIFDSISTLLIYEESIAVTKFTHFLMAKMTTKGAQAVFTSLKEDITDDVIKDINLFADKVIDLSSEKIGTKELLKKGYIKK